MNEKILVTDNTIGTNITSIVDGSFPTRPRRPGLCIRIETAENGHIVHVAHREGEISKPYIAAKYEDVADIVMRELAAAALERT